MGEPADAFPHIEAALPCIPSFAEEVSAIAETCSELCPWGVLFCAELAH